MSADEAGTDPQEAIAPTDGTAGAAEGEEVLAIDDVLLLEAERVAGTTQPEDLRPGRLYRAFQEEFRGSRELITERQRRYIPYVEEALRNVDGGSFLDVGCGRGEFMQLVAAAGGTPVGLEGDDDLAADARSLGLDVRVGDANEFLESVDEASLAGVSANSVVEHMQSDYLFRFLRLLSLKVAPGGCVVLETINPECAFALGVFWLDLTHVRPYHADMLSFYLSQLGFSRILKMYTSPAPEAVRVEAIPTANYIEYTVVAFR